MGLLPGLASRQVSAPALELKPIRGQNPCEEDCTCDVRSDSPRNNSRHVKRGAVLHSKEHDLSGALRADEAHGKHRETSLLVAVKSAWSKVALVVRERQHCEWPLADAAALSVPPLISYRGKAQLQGRSRAPDGTRCDAGQSELETFRVRVTLRPKPVVELGDRRSAGSSGKFPCAGGQQRCTWATRPSNSAGEKNGSKRPRTVAFWAATCWWSACSRPGHHEENQHHWAISICSRSANEEAQLRSRSTIHHRVSWPKTAKFRVVAVAP